MRREAGGGDRAERVADRVEQRHARRHQRDDLQERQDRIEPPQQRGGAANLRRDLLVVRARRFGEEDLAAADRQARQDGDEQRDHAHAAEPVGQRRARRRCRARRARSRGRPSRRWSSGPTSPRTSRRSARGRSTGRECPRTRRSAATTADTTRALRPAACASTASSAARPPACRIRCPIAPVTHRERSRSRWRRDTRRRPGTPRAGARNISPNTRTINPMTWTTSERRIIRLAGRHLKLVTGATEVGLHAVGRLVRGEHEDAIARLDAVVAARHDHARGRAGSRRR